MKLLEINCFVEERTGDDSSFIALAEFDSGNILDKEGRGWIIDLEETHDALRWVGMTWGFYWKD